MMSSWGKFVGVSSVILVTACSGPEGPSAQDAQLSSVIEGQLVVSHRAPGGAVRGEVYDHDLVVATLDLDASGRGSLEVPGLAPATVAMPASAPLADVNDGLHWMWAAATRGSHTSAVPLYESWSSDNGGYCGSSGYGDCAATCPSYYYEANGAGCMCFCGGAKVE